MARSLSPDFAIKVGDRRPALRITCNQGDGTALDLTGATVTFSMKTRGGGPVKVSAQACTVITAASGIVEYRWAAADTDTAGDYDAEFRISLPGTLQTTVPGNGYLWVQVQDAVA
jgi:hypothetical protein